jgi:hypothetical protein
MKHGCEGARDYGLQENDVERNTSYNWGWKPPGKCLSFVVLFEVGFGLRLQEKSIVHDFQFNSHTQTSICAWYSTLKNSS